MTTDTSITRREALAAILAAPLVAALPPISELPLAASLPSGGTSEWSYVVPSGSVRKVFLTSIFVGHDAIPVADALRYTVNLSGMPS